MDEKLQAAIDALLEIRDLPDPNDSIYYADVQQAAQKALTKIWCDYYRHEHKNSWMNPLPALSPRMLG